MGKGQLENQGRRQVRWEARVVRHLLEFYGLEGKAADLMRECEERTGEPRLQFCWFLKYYPTFPVRLVPLKIDYLHEMTFADLFGRFTATRLYKAFEAAVEIVADDSVPYGLVFEWLHVDGMMIIHNHQGRRRRHSCTRIIRRVGAGKDCPGQVVMVEGFRPFLQSLPWKPGQ
jgi:hypothetical protein